MLLINTLLLYAGKMKYWDKSKGQKSYYQNDPEKEKPGRKRDVGLKEKFLACSVAAETWSFGKASCRHVHNFCTVTRIYTTWVRFSALTFKVHYLAGHDTSLAIEEFP